VSPSRSERKPTPAWRRRLRLTSEGWYYSIVTIGVGLAAINTGNNLLYLVLGLLLSLIVVSGILSETSLQGIEIVRRLPARAEAGRPFFVEVELQNVKSRRRTYSVELEDQLESKSVGRRCYFLKVGPGGSQVATYRTSIAERGVHRFRGFRVSTRFPFGLFDKSREMDVPGEILVYPARVPVPSVAPPRAPGAGDEPSRRVGPGTEFFALREYHPGDDPRSVHWRTSARSDRLLVRERERDSRRGVRVYLDNALPPDAGAADATEMERAVSLAASLCADLVRRGLRVRLLARSGETAEAEGPRALDAPLSCLARLPILRAAEAPPPPGAPADVAVAHRRGTEPPRAEAVLWVGE
jgi:uncharacterized protein (DUF58 family)